jgi:hypothetical protein
MGSPNNNSDFPTRTILGVDYSVAESLMLFAEQEFTPAEHENTQTTRFGMKATPWSGGTISTSGGTRFTEYGPRIFANLGLRQTWNLNER